ncbi:hypothetical protein ACGF07_33110 [Kitasatospora sp. NPDC048194]|uniref:hypothetical protein n=1 Tax=Kitasatospora sp. NPDC048194 TaxID=3364045 RepID=UPI003721B8A6
MDRPLRLPQQDRADFEAELARALAAPQVRAALRDSGEGAQGVERLRRTARENAAYVLAAAAPEYERYTALRVGSESPARPPADLPEAGRVAGWWGVLAVVVPIVAGAAAAVLLLLGWLLGLAEDADALGRALVTAGWVSAGAAAVSLLGGGLGLLAAAARPQGPAAAEAADGGDELARARDAWRSSLAERGLVPYLVAQAKVAPGQRR